MAGSPQFSISWRSLALTSILFNLGAVATIATIAAVQNNDVLNTVALALAVIAFVCQLIIYSIQAWQNGQQLQEARQLNANTLSWIAEARTRIEGTHQMVTSQYQEFVHLVTLKAGSEVARSVKNPETMPTALEAVAQTVQKIENSATETWWTRLPGAAPSALFFTWTNSAQTADGSMSDLEFMQSNGLLSMFFLSVDDDISSSSRGIESGLPYVPNVDKLMIEHGLLKKRMSINGTQQIVVITDKGRLASSNLLAPWPPPKNFGITDRINEVLGRLDEETRETIKRLKNVKTVPH
jgi:type II secretory pathway pseudopilin PulG